MSVFIVIPCYNVKNKIYKVISRSLKYADKIIIVDDKCPEQTGNYVKNKIKNKKILVIFNNKNLGVGGATMIGYKAAIKLNANVIVKMDGDGQMNPYYIPNLVKNIKEGKAGYCKGNRFINKSIINKMPLIRLVGNFFLSFLSKSSTGYWNIFDFTNGYTAISSHALKKISFSNISKNFFFETDILYNLYLKNIKVMDVDIPAIYNDSKSNLKISNVFLYFLRGNIKNFLKRVYLMHLKKNFFKKIIYFVILTVTSYYYSIIFYEFIILVLTFFILDFLKIPIRKND
jgi:dolichol-phosphate mannosyltransferase